MELRDACLTAGIHEAEFWDMTIGEAVREIDAFGQRRRDKAYFEYTNAMAVGMFISAMFSSKQPPKMEEIYPELFGDTEEQKEEDAQRLRDESSAANFIKFANSFNRRYEANGNRKSESENNG